MGKVRTAARRLVLGLVLVPQAALVPTGWASTQVASIVSAPTVGPPTTKVVVTGHGFGSLERVDLRFDNIKSGKAKTDSNGAFTGHVSAPASALPGPHTISARGRQSGSLAQATFTVRTDWPKFHFDLAGTGWNPYENVLDPSSVPGLALSWKALAAPSESVITGSVTVVGGRVYLGASGVSDQVFIDSFDSTTGQLVWQTPEAGGLTPSGVAVSDGTLYVGTLLDHQLHAYKTTTGELLWTFQSTGPMGTPAVVDGIVYSASDTRMYAIDATTGTKVWSAITRGTIWGIGSPVVGDGVLYFGSNKVFAYDAHTGQQLWSVPVGGNVNTALAAAARVVYVGSDNHKLNAIDTATHALIWTADVGTGFVGSPAVANGVVYAGSTDFNVYAFDASTGATLWTAPTGSYASLSPFAADGVVYASSFDHSIYAFDAATGHGLWSYATGAVPAASGAIVDGRMYSGSQDGYLYSFALP